MVTMRVALAIVAAVAMSLLGWLFGIIASPCGEGDFDVAKMKGTQENVEEEIAWMLALM
jgi:hypothetical protein